MRLFKPILTSLLLCIGISGSAYSKAMDGGPANVTRAGETPLIDYTYYQGDEISFTGFDGVSRQSAAIKIDPAAIKGMKIKSIYALGFENTSEFGNLTFWISSTLSHSHDIIETASGPIVDGKGETVLDSELEVPETTFYVGYDMDVYSALGLSIPFSKGDPVPGGAFLTYGNAKFYDYSGAMGPLTIGLVVEPQESLAESSVILMDYGATVMVAPGDPINVLVNVLNNGTTPVQKFTYSYETGDLSHNLDIDLTEPIQPDMVFCRSVNLILDPITEEGVYDLTIYAPQVNGVDNPSNTSGANVKVMVTLPPDTSVLDGATPFAYTSEPANDWYQPSSLNDVCMLVQSPEFEGMEILGARVTGLTRTKGVGNFKGWMTTSLENDFDIETIDTENPDEDGVLTIVFKKPYKLDSNGIYVGYSCEVLEKTQENSQGVIPVYATWEEGKFPNACFIRLGGKGGTFRDVGYWYGCAATITVYLRGELPPDNCSVGKMCSHSVVEKGAPFTLTFEMSNNGGNNVESIDYSYTLGDEEISKSITFAEPMKPGIGINNLVDIEFEGPASAGSYPMTFTVDKVNGKPNNANKNSTECVVNVIDHKVPHRVLMEEATGTWCGWCPRGWLALREMTDRHSDFIGIAYHGNDPMTVGSIPFNNPGFPYSSLDRTLNSDPFYGTSNSGTFGIEEDWQKLTDQLTLADIDLKAEWNDDKSVLDVTSTVTFVLPMENADYKIGYTLVGNGYSKSGNVSWMQKNYYSGTEQSGLLEELTKLPQYIANIVYNDVAICSDYSSGVKGSIPGTIAVDEPYFHKQSFNTVSIKGMKGDELLTDKDTLEVVAYVISPDGRIVNSNKLSAKQFSTGTTDVQAMEVERTYYSLDGLRVSHPSKGMYVVHTLMSNGKIKVEKVFLR